MSFLKYFTQAPSAPPIAVVITPTIGSTELRQAIESVKNQDCEVLHLIVTDGAQFQGNVERITRRYKSTLLQTVVLPANTGNGLTGHRYNGHRIYAGFSYLVNTKYVFFLDEDNWFDRNHISSLVELIEDEKLDWAYSLRKIFTGRGTFVTNDDCENLGTWSPFSGRENLVDTNCYALKRDVLTKVCQTWYHPLGADRIFFRELSSKFTNFRTTSLYTVNYRLHDHRPPTPEFFVRGNQYMLKLYNNNLPWRQSMKDTRADS